jgi:hypothetical protein
VNAVCTTAQNHITIIILINLGSPSRSGK